MVFWIDCQFIFCKVGIFHFQKTLSYSMNFVPQTCLWESEPITPISLDPLMNNNSIVYGYNGSHYFWLEGSRESHNV